MGNTCFHAEASSHDLMRHSSKTFHVVEPISRASEESEPDSCSSQDKDTPENEKGVILLPDGSKYEGELRNGVPHGFGVEVHENGDRFEGHFVEGVKNGKGKYRYASGVCFTGEFVQGAIEGEGCIQWPNGDSYSGGFRHNIINGFGKYYSKQSESYYEGSYLEGKKHGQGKIVCGQGSLEGYWEHGQFRFKKYVASGLA